MIRLSFIITLLLLPLALGQGKNAPDPAPEVVARSEDYEVTKHFDAESKTYYFLTRIRHTDRDGKIIKLRHARAIKKDGETVREFAIRAKTALAINGSMCVQSLAPAIRRPTGIVIVDGVILQDDPVGRRHTLGIKADNELVAYRPGMKAADILKDGARDALTAFIPLIEGHQPVSPAVLKTVGNSDDRHPRQVIAQFGNRDILFLSCGGRTFDGDGMTADDLIRILMKLGVRFAFNLDGGGSTSTVVGERLVTRNIDQKGTQERPRANFLYIEGDRGNARADK